jgi:large subunit ribosomal protein L22
MQVRASAKGVRMSARKAQLVVETIRGRQAEEALAVLRFLPHAAARAVYQVVRSAIANAENNYSLDPAALRVVSATADQGPSYPPMYRPKARGQAGVVKRRTTHITVIVDDEPPTQRPAPRARR